MLMPTCCVQMFLVGDKVKTKFRLLPYCCCCQQCILGVSDNKVQEHAVSSSLGQSGSSGIVKMESSCCNTANSLNRGARMCVAMVLRSAELKILPGCVTRSSTCIAWLICLEDLHDLANPHGTVTVTTVVSIQSLLLICEPRA